MQKIIDAILIILLVLPAASHADEGWWTATRIQGSTLYSEVDHPAISLEKEIVIYDVAQGEESCDIYFLFRNTSNQLVTVKAGFPAEIVIPLTIWSPLDPGEHLVAKLFDKPLDEYAGRLWQSIIEDAKTFKLAIRKFIPWNEFEGYNLFWRDQQWIQLAIAQDGINALVDSVFIEARVTSDSVAKVTFHFVHQLKFAPNAVSTVHVQYKPFDTVMNSGSVFWAKLIHWRYILATGRTWHGRIEKAYIIVPDYLKPDLPKQFREAGAYLGKTLLLAENYEPAETDKIEIKRAKFSFVKNPHNLHDLPPQRESQIIHVVKKPRAPAQKFVRLKAASSALKQRTWINSLALCIASPPMIRCGRSFLRLAFIRHSTRILDRMTKHIP
ncbi:hypothetical protein JXJ21_07580 [candidate division KSB1 bacterium]|nr:hypothetical protein [candidate division KSB1 bacterium]